MNLNRKKCTKHLNIFNYIKLLFIEFIIKLILVFIDLSSRNSTNKEEHQQQSDTSYLDDEEDVVAQIPDTSIVSPETISNM